MKEDVLSLLKKRMPEGNVPVEEIEKVCRDVAFDVVSASCEDKEKREALRRLCDVLHFPVQPVQPVQRQLPELAKDAPSPLKDGFAFLLAGAAYYVGYKLGDSHWAGGIACVAAGVCASRFLASKESDAPAALPESSPEGVCPALEELAGKIGKAVELLKKILEQPEGAEDMLDNKYFKVLSYLYDTYLEYISAEIVNEFHVKVLEGLFRDYGYELIQFSEEKAACFNSSVATTVSVRTTTIPALLKQQTGECIFKGHVLYPETNND